MAIKRSEWYLILFNLVYFIPFSIYYISIKNFEFLGYIFVMVFLFIVIFSVQRKINFSNLVLWLLSFWGLMHMVGGGIIVRDAVVYKLQLIPIWVTSNFYILKYDQFVHAYLYFVAIFVIWHLLKDNINSNMNNWILYPVLALISIGIGSLNEIVEFIAVLSLPETGVGGYYNTAWDIVFNSIGAVLGVIVLHWRRKRLK